MKRLLILAILFLPMLALADTQVATDSCTRANGAIGANWTVGEGTWSISSNTCIVSASTGNNEAAWTHDAFTNDQYSTVKVAAWLSGANHIGPAVRVSGKNGYMVYCSTTSSSNCTHFVLAIVTNGVATAMTGAASPAVSVAVTNGVTLRVVGASPPVLNAMSGSTVVASAFDVGNTYTSGSAGMMSNITFTSTNGVTSWSGGNLIADSILRPSTDAAVGAGVTLSACNNNSTTASNAQTLPLYYDASGLSTSTNFVETASGAFDTEDLARTFTTWPAAAGAYTSLTLSTGVSCTASGSGSFSNACGINYSLDGGSTWTSMGNTFTTVALTLSVPLTTSQILSNVIVRPCVEAATGTGGGSSASTTMAAQDVWMVGTLNAAAARHKVVVSTSK